ncbi:MAG: hypothetical protein HY216_10140 [Candidatus Rokubacteria bacterium]|nr:hypothetical protein [Candidatus Rokubacteria bacterium]
MSRAARALLLVVMGLLASSAAAGDGVTATFAAPLERVWAATEAALDAQGWDVSETQRPLGLIVTKTRRLSGDDQIFIAKSVRVRLRVRLVATGDDRTMVTVEREILTRERLLFVERDVVAGPRDPLAVRDLERNVLRGIARAL